MPENPTDVKEDSNSEKQGFIARIFGYKGNEEPSGEARKKILKEILSLAEKGKEKGVIDKTTISLIKNIFEFDNTVVSEIMIHRIDVIAVEASMTMAEVVKIAIDSGYSRIPVYKDDIDNIVGILYVKDLLSFISKGVPENFKVTDISRDVIYIPRGKKVSQLFTEMTKHKVQLAIVVDEYGGTEGLITMENLIEEILGNIQDEYDNEKETVKVINENKFTVDGSTPIEDVERLTGVEFNSSDCETIAGYILENLEQVPDEKEKPVFVKDDLKFTVLKMEDRRINKVLIEKKIKEFLDNKTIKSNNEK